MKNFKNKLLLFFFVIFLATILSFSIRGNFGNPTSTQLQQLEWRDEGPFELSPERGRFALLYSIVENNSFTFDEEIAKFALPDLGFINGKFVSLFAPGVSFIVIPGYILGKQFGIAQVGTYAVIALFALLNTLLIRLIAIRLGVNAVAATIASMVFLFATPAFVYGVNLYQHHISTFLILMCIYTFLRWKSLWSLIIIWFLCAASIVVDYPNAIFLLPIGLFALGRIIVLTKEKNGYTIQLKFLGILTFFVMIIPLLFFMWFNTNSYGKPFQFSGTIQQIQNLDEASLLQVQEPKDQVSLQPASKETRSAVGFFKTRNMLNGLYAHFISPDRGIVWFTPVILFSIFGIGILYKKNSSFCNLLIGILGVTIILYSMWGDPWGGWAFGSRYMIPCYALASIFLAFALHRFKKNILFLLVFYIVLFYSVSVNTLGVITSSRNPPRVEVLALEKISGIEQKYTYERNIDLLKSNNSKSFLWLTFAKSYVTATEYFWILVGSIMSINIILVMYLRFFAKEMVK